MFWGKPDYNKKEKLNYEIDLVELTLYEVFFYLKFHSNDLAETGIDRAFKCILGKINRGDKTCILLPYLKMVNYKLTCP